jgi:hypothetical protein
VFDPGRKEIADGLELGTVSSEVIHGQALTIYHRADGLIEKGVVE